MLYQPDWLIQQMAEVNEANLTDLCQILEYGSSTTDRYNRPVPGWTAREDPENPGDPLSVPCGVEYLSSREVVPPTQTTLVQARVRLARGTQVDTLDRITITHIRGVALDPPQQYNIVGAPKLLPSLVLLELTSVTIGGG